MKNTIIINHDSAGDKMTDKKSEAKQLIELGYSSKAIELFENKVNVGVIENPDADTVFLDPCGDLICLYIKMNNEIVEDAKFLCYGRQGSTSALSAMTILIKGKTLNQVKKLTEDDILKELEGLPEDCAELSIKTLKKAIDGYRKSKGRSET
jgi:nitrogen fixation NifU-like protein